MRLVLSLLGLLAFATTQHAAEIELKLRQQVLQGELVTDGPKELTIRQKRMLHGEVQSVDIVVRKEDILSRTVLPSLAERYAAKLAQTPAEATAICGLAQWCYEQCMRDEAYQQALRALAIEPELAWARRVLENCGYVRANGTWQDETAWLASRGQVRIGNRVVPVELAKDLRSLRLAMNDLSVCAEVMASKEKAVLLTTTNIAHANEEATGNATLKAETEVANLKKRMDQFAALGRDSSSNDPKSSSQRDATIDRIVTELRRRQIDLLTEIDKSLQAQNKAASSLKTLQERLVSETAELAKAKSAVSACQDRIREMLPRLPIDDPDAVAAKTAISPTESAAR